ncbi:MAG TPA: aminoglycoside phosphotransferase family protein [Terracidiphilus sp.]|jgi:Ser/Thr protein kinase RdoA (MazF antagonist)
MNRAPGLSRIARQFQIEGEFRRAVPYGSGHINDTYCAFFDRPDAASRSNPSRCILQRINQNVFRDPAAVMENIERVTAHVAAQIAAEPDRARRVLTLIPSRDGHAWHVDEDGGYWRAYRMIEDAHTCDEIHSPEQAFEAARAFGRFQRQLAGLPPPRLQDTIPDFHHTPKRFAVLEEMIEQDPAGRVAGAEPEIAFALKRKPMTAALLGAGLPERVTHNDTKFNNVLLDDRTGEAICVIDLDTVMPGLAPYDFGDLVRTAASPAKEDEQDLSRVGLQFPFFEAIARGYLSTAGEFLTRAEKELLAFAGKLITFEQGVRFLADYLAGDTYYKVLRAGQNLDRCRAQFKLVASIEAQEDAMERLVRSIG